MMLLVATLFGHVELPHVNDVGAGDAFWCCQARLLIWILELATTVHPIGLTS
jgi:hypothetical protein